MPPMSWNRRGSERWCSTPMPVSWTAAWAFVPRRLMVLDEDFDRAETAAARRCPGMPCGRETFLDGQVRVNQPESGFRSGLDAVMLAAAVPARAGQTALELGAGAGTASLCLAARVPGPCSDGCGDRHRPGRAGRPTMPPPMAWRGAICRADIFALPSELKRDFDHVFCNPPFHGEGQVSPDADARHRADG